MFYNDSFKEAKKPPYMIIMARFLLLLILRHKTLHIFIEFNAKSIASSYRSANYTCT